MNAQQDKRNYPTPFCPACGRPPPQRSEQQEWTLSKEQLNGCHRIICPDGYETGYVPTATAKMIMQRGNAALATEWERAPLVEAGSKLANLLKDSYWAQCPMDVAKAADELLGALAKHNWTERQLKGQEIQNAEREQEWTEHDLHELVIDLRREAGRPEDIHRRFFDLLQPWFAAHNAALVAERKRYESLMQGKGQFAQADIDAIRKPLEQQLTAECKRREQAERDYKICDTMRVNAEKRGYVHHQQLISALAAIEKHNSLWEDGRAEQIKGFDLSLLRQHDAELLEKDRKARPQPHFDKEVKAYCEKRIAEVRKPLVKALEQALSDIETSNAPISTCSKIRTALWKVTENK